MLKEVVRYKDYNDNDREETLYFNLTKTEAMDLLDLQPRLQAWADKANEPDRELDVTEIQDMLSIAKILIQKSYGVRSEDGKHFRKSPELFDDFASSAAYDAFVFGIFERPERLMLFMMGILPSGLNDAALDRAKESANELISEMQKARGDQAVQTVEMPADNEIKAVDAEIPKYILEDRDPTRAELMSMSQEEMRAAFQRRAAKQ